ncbi:MAG: tetratricopeptide repeat protein [Firmicutes bacterium]|nr:tetratricopeptide repeat protein [Bacillota bacterium]
MEKWGRVGSYLEKYADTLVFDQFQESYLRREGIYDFMKDVPVPMSTGDVVDFHTQKGLDVMNVVKNMVRIIGINPQFPYVESYLKYIRKYFDKTVAEAVIRDGEKRAQEGAVEEALIYFRAALILEPKQKYALYDYGLATRQLAESDSDDDAYRGALKADSIEAFEELSVQYPDFYPTYYYLGYIYMNMGLYTKAKLIFELYLKLSDGTSTEPAVMDPSVLSEQRREVKERLEQLEEPVKIEAGVNHILAGRPEPGLQILKPYVGGAYDQWWPLHYYLGAAYVGVGQMDEAIERFQRVLQLNPSHVETMNELAEIYEARGDQTMGEKYRNKIKLVKEN